MNSIVGRIRNTPLTREADERHQRLLLLVLAVVVGFAVPVFFYVWQHNRYVALSYEAQELKQHLAGARDQSRELRARVEELTSPAEVKRRLEAQGLELVAPVPEETRILLPPGETETRDGPAETMAVPERAAHEGRTR